VWAGERVIYLGLDYAGVRTAFDALAFDISPDLWRQLQVMEEAARDRLNGFEG
jgi:hypothetical protein